MERRSIYTAEEEDAALDTDDGSEIGSIPLVIKRVSDDQRHFVGVNYPGAESRTDN